MIGQSDPAAAQLSADTTSILLVACTGVLCLAIGTLIGWILRDRLERTPPLTIDAQIDAALRAHNDTYHPGRPCRENDEGACADRSAGSKS